MKVWNFFCVRTITIQLTPSYTSIKIPVLGSEFFVLDGYNICFNSWDKYVFILFNPGVSYIGIFLKPSKDIYYRMKINSYETTRTMETHDRVRWHLPHF